MTLVSMTGFAERRGMAGSASWLWEIRSVNNKGLDLRIRLPEGFESLDAIIRSQSRISLQRGSVTVVLKLLRAANAGLAQVSEAGLAAAISAIREAEEAAMAAGLHLSPITAGDILNQRGVLDYAEQADVTPWIAAMAQDIAPLFVSLNAMRGAEGQAIGKVIATQIERVAALLAAASDTLEARAARAGAGLKQRLAQILSVTDLPDESRLAQELALIAVKSDVSEELDRLGVHVDAAREMIRAGGSVGRKLDFLMQEFNREANTLCSKSASSDLTNIGLDLKVVIDQAREQVQNVE